MANLPAQSPTQPLPATPVTSCDAAVFWQFSLALYPHFQQRLLQWQDEQQAQVNLLLFLAWRDRNACAPWQALQQALLPTHQQFTLPIRQLRRQATNHPALRQQLLQAELAAEQLEQAALCQCRADTDSDGRTELRAYLQALAVPTAACEQFLLDLDQALLQHGVCGQ